jgi:N-acetylmuramoyl-L-alanine amidase
MTAVEPVSNYLGAQGLDPRSDLAGLNLSAVPAIYLECGNMRNATDAALMSGAAGRQALARRLAAGILAFLHR